MSVLIRGTKMPKTCNECQSTLGLFCDECPLFAEFPKKFDYDPEIGNNRRYDGCPLVEVPSHGELIDGTKLISDICEKVDEVKYEKGSPDGEELWKIMCNILETAPTVVESEEE